MVYFVLLLFIGLTFILLFYAVAKIKEIGTSNTIEKNYNFSIHELDLNRWRGGVRFPAGYYKTKEEFYQIEKNLRYHR